MRALGAHISKIEAKKRVDEWYAAVDGNAQDTDDRPRFNIEMHTKIGMKQRTRDFVSMDADSLTATASYLLHVVAVADDARWQASRACDVLQHDAPRPLLNLYADHAGEFTTRYWKQCLHQHLRVRVPPLDLVLNGNTA